MLVEPAATGAGATAEARRALSAAWSGASYARAAVGANELALDAHRRANHVLKSSINAVDMVTVVTEGIFSYCGVKVKIDTDRYLGPETNTVRAQGEAVGHVTTSEYGSQMLSLGGVRHLTGGSRQEGKASPDPETITRRYSSVNANTVRYG